MKEVKRFLKSIPPAIWWILVLCFLIICSLPAAFTQLPSIINFTETGQIGDTIGGIMGPFIAVVAALLTFIAFWVQFEANKELIQENRRNHFENRFYKMLDIHLDTVASINEVAGDDSVFHKWCNEILNVYNKYVVQSDLGGFLSGERAKYRNNSNEQSYLSFLKSIDDDIDMRKSVLFEMTYSLFFTGDFSTIVFGNSINTDNARRFAAAFTFHLASLGDQFKSKPQNELLGRYYRHLFQIVKFVDSQDDKLFEDENWKKEYVGMLRSQMSDYEQLLLYYNAQSSLGRAWDKHHFISEYKMIRNIPHGAITACAGESPFLRYQEEIRAAEKRGEQFFERM